MLEIEEIRSLIKPRQQFAHKGNFGHALLIAGSKGMAGASVLAARACLRSGVGLLTVHAPLCNNDILQTSAPEAMVETDVSEHALPYLPIRTITKLSASVRDSVATKKRKPP